MHWSTPVDNTVYVAHEKQEEAKWELPLDVGEEEDELGLQPRNVYIHLPQTATRDPRGLRAVGVPPASLQGCVRQDAQEDKTETEGLVVGEEESPGDVPSLAVHSRSAHSDESALCIACECRVALSDVDYHADCCPGAPQKVEEAVSRSEAESTSQPYVLPQLQAQHTDSEEPQRDPPRAKPSSASSFWGDMWGRARDSVLSLFPGAERNESVIANSLSPSDGKSVSGGQDGESEDRRTGIREVAASFAAGSARAPGTHVNSSAGGPRRDANLASRGRQQGQSHVTGIERERPTESDYSQLYRPLAVSEVNPMVTSPFSVPAALFHPPGGGLGRPTDGSAPFQYGTLEARLHVPENGVVFADLSRRGEGGPGRHHQRRTETPSRHWQVGVASRHSAWGAQRWQESNSAWRTSLENSGPMSHAAPYGHIFEPKRVEGRRRGHREVTMRMERVMDERPGLLKIPPPLPLYPPAGVSPKQWATIVQKDAEIRREARQWNQAALRTDVSPSPSSAPPPTR
uniref:Uncharacterized protein n=1 Tax=Chromera velia CCMP2878 TaxID=1169474 RepID=A0A0G4HCE7_9ALVE|eukprot:Cvel_6277.t1-p1 / transcript=Cvel_6277.t1 / gene=Cvel_6277 / organism=Chromera_velia_CCMP2878 / gene_product=hypothetical protein / transcript_product=hypothetical protein / location=Cvel_scaffold304:93883-96774(+) / protein_length=515 / sequence_SO=supercontig / SO=protein_coding / is_pseudo=false